MSALKVGDWVRESEEYIRKHGESDPPIMGKIISVNLSKTYPYSVQYITGDIDIYPVEDGIYTREELTLIDSPVVSGKICLI